MSMFTRANNFDKLLDKATSNLRLDPDWPTILQICDLIRQNDCSPKYAISALKKKLSSQNPHQAMFAVLVLESIVKNCGSGMHDEVASKAFCETLRDLVKTSQHENFRNKILELIQAWGFAFRNNPKYRAVQDTVNILKAEGFKFPTLKESDAMFSSDMAPEWAEGEVCHRCRVAFTLMVRRHHCRACGQVFCQQCSSKTSTIPKFGIEKEVRVCDACFDKVSRPPAATTTKLEIQDPSNDYGQVQQQKRAGGKSEDELREEEELQLALALSQSEAEHKEKERKSRPHIAPDPTPHRLNNSPTPSSVSASPEHGMANSELSRYLDRGYWEQRLSRESTSAAPTAPTSQVPASPSEDYGKQTTNKTPENDNEDRELDDFVGTLKSQVEIFVNRMKSNSSRGRSIANDTSVQSLFMTITAMHSRLVGCIEQQDDKRVYLESLQDKVTQVRDSRAALDTLRAEHAARLAAAAEAAERQRQMQMAAKLQAMRKKKHEYLQYQRQLALQRVQEQEREMQMRQEQQKHQYMLSAGSSYYVPGVSMHQFQGGYQNQPIYANAQYHSQMMPQATIEGIMTVPSQSQISQANMGLGTNISTVSQSMVQMPQTMSMSTANGMINPAVINAQPSMNQANMRPNLTQQLPVQSQLLMQQMHQMRMPMQQGTHQILPQNLTKGMLNQQNMNQQNDQAPKQNPNQQIPGTMMTQMQQNLPQAQMNPSNPMMGMQIPNVRMGMVQHNQVPSHPQMPHQMVQSQQANHMGQAANQNLHQPSQLPMQNQVAPVSGAHIIQNQLPNQGQPMGMQPQMLQAGQHLPISTHQVSQQGQQMPNQVHHPKSQTQMNQGHHYQAPGQQIQIQGQQLPNQTNQNSQSAPVMQQQMQMQVPQQIPMQGQQMQHGARMQQPVQQQSQGQQLPTHSQQVQGQQRSIQHQNPQSPQDEHMKMPQQSQAQVGVAGQQSQITQVKNEHNNNTAELISFD